MAAEIKPFRVSELNEAANQLLQDAYSSIWVQGEITGWKPYSSGHIYFSLKEGETARIDCAMWQSFALRLPAGVEFKDGMAVLAHGKLGVYKNRGQFQLYIDKLVPQGLGAAEEALRRLREKLLKLGYFDPNRKRPLPLFPHRVAVVTSGSGAAVRDVIAVLGKLAPMIEVIVVPVRVQGASAALEIAAALDRLSRWHNSGTVVLDAIIVGRGGGSSEDLQAFNDENVAKAIYTAAVPVVSAVGHEIDYVISDQVADVRAATPTHAAELLSKAWARVGQLLVDRRQRLAAALISRHAAARQRLLDLASRRVLQKPLAGIRDRQQRLDEVEQRIQASIRRVWQIKFDKFRSANQRLEALSPMNVLARGYSLTQTGDRRVVREAASVAIGEILMTRVQRGQITSRVLSIEPEPPV
jgi:exodeoxyribonuclease VII large subunit